MESEPEPDANITGQLILIAVLTLLNAFFAAAEMAIVSLNKNKIKHMAEEGNKKAKALEKLIAEPTKFLSTIQVGITLAGFFSSAAAATGISGNLAKYLKGLSIPYSSKIALVLVTVVLSYISLVFGELYPKRVALQKSEAIAMFAVRPILYVSKIAVPFIKLLSASTNMLVRATGLDKEDLEEKVSKEEIKSLVEVGQEHGVINETEKEMINSIFEFDDKLAEEVMTPRPDVYMINIDTPVEKYVDELLEEKYSRIPVYEGDIDNIIGVLYMKDFIVKARKDGFENICIKEILHKPYFVPEKKNIDSLFKDLQRSKKHMAILIDEYGGFSGIVTIEDLIEEVVGNINDEYDDDEPEIKKIGDNTFIVDGLISVDELNDKLHLNIDTNTENYETVSGFLINIIGRIPTSAEEKVIEHDDVIFKIEEVKEKRIEKVKVCIQEKQQQVAQ
ncbi:hemolysin family protein [Clostridium oryzae]|uniref:Magnesium and cobalt efflux protein CorC n=1 Tax=Clostridium oryzae TaxID=1450648 RepID=A0A1V4IEF9_9CLOT|nr:hemolysin family protein [Clostridium oryzae]OPJ58398.1 magnesium and cobalt efflux protein CorC [Clostridium oryzae]